jgi:TonB family protein
VSKRIHVSDGIGTIGSLGRIACAALTFAVAATAVASAQTWNWTYSTAALQSARGPAAASLELTSTEITTSNRIALAGRPDVVYSCHIKLADVSRAIAVHTGSQSLLIQLKPDRAAACQVIGNAQSVVMRADDGALIDKIAAAINNACCTVAAVPERTIVRERPTPAPERETTVAARASEKPTEKPAPEKTTPQPAASSAFAFMRVDDWIETDGAFAFLRIRNLGNRPIAITGGEVRDCTNADVGCGRIARRTTILPYGVITYATVASADPQKAPSFDYSYSAQMVDYTFDGNGNSSKEAPSGAARMSAEQVRSAEAQALAALRGPNGPSASVVAQDQPPRVVKPGVAEPVNGKSGQVQVRVTLAPDGSPQDAAIVSSTNDELDDAGVEFAVSSTYAPAIHAGKPVAADLVVTVSFLAGEPSINATTSAR